MPCICSRPGVGVDVGGTGHRETATAFFFYSHKCKGAWSGEGILRKRGATCGDNHDPGERQARGSWTLGKPGQGLHGLQAL